MTHPILGPITSWLILPVFWIAGAWFWKTFIMRESVLTVVIVVGLTISAIHFLVDPVSTIISAACTVTSSDCGD